MESCSIPYVEPCNLDVSYPLGGGSAFTVYRTVYQEQDAVVKTLNDQETSQSFFWQEYQLHKAVQHPRLVKCLAANAEESLLVLEFMPMGSLSKLLFHDSWVPLSPSITLSMAQQLAEGMHYLHTRNILHGNLSPSNVLVGDFCDVKLGGLSCCTLDDVRRPKRCAPPPYLAPEVLSGQAYAAASDVYAFGVVLWEMISRRKAFGHNMVQLLLHGSSGLKFDLPVDAHPLIQGLICNCLEDDPVDRPTFESVWKTLKQCVALDEPQSTLVSPFCLLDLQLDVVPLVPSFSAVSANRPLMLQSCATV